MPADTPFGFGLPGGDLPDPNDPQQMQRFVNQMHQMFASSADAPVNWDLARQIAQAHLTGGSGASGLPFGTALPPALAAALPTGDAEPSAPVGDPAVTPADRVAIDEALRLADLWLEPESSLPSGISATEAWTRSQWIGYTLPVWRKLCDPVAERMVGAMTDLVPPELRAQLGPMTSMVTSLGGALFGGQLGTALGSLAGEVLSAGDIGLPLGPAGAAALVPANIDGYGKGLEIPGDQVRLYVALREAAHQRLFGHVAWLRGHVLTAVEAYAAGITINREAIEEAMGRLDPTNPEGMQEIVLEGVFVPEDTPQQKAALHRLELALALVEGWVCHVVDRAAAQRLPEVARLSEAFRRRRAAGGPAEQTFSALVGLELRPRRLREATALWAALAEHRGIDGRDALWGHPDLMPDEDAFVDPDKYAQSSLDVGEFADFNDLGDFGDLDAPGTPDARDKRGETGKTGEGGSTDQGPGGTGDGPGSDPGDRA